MSLRVLLIFIGVVIIVGVYLFTAAKRRRDTRIRFDRRFSGLDVPDVILRHDHDEEDDDIPLKSPAPMPSALLAGRGVILPPEDISLEELPHVVNDIHADKEPTNARRASDQLDMFGAAGNETDEPRRASRSVAKAAPESDNGLINLFVRARKDRTFRGPDVVRVLNTLGLRHGDMSVFHHYGAGELLCEEAVFSAANMFEPGTFDLGRIEAFQTSGIVLFMQLPTPLDGPVAFELLLSTGQRLSELLDGELFASPKTPLGPDSIARLRQRAAQFRDGRS